MSKRRKGLRHARGFGNPPIHLNEEPLFMKLLRQSYPNIRYEGPSKSDDSEGETCDWPIE